MFKSRRNQAKQAKAQTQFNVEQKKEVLRKREMAKDILYPILLADSTSIENAKVICQSASIAIRQKFNNGLSTTSIKELGIIEDLNKEATDLKAFQNLLVALQGEKLSVGLELLDGMAGAIDSFIKEENTKRKLSEVKATFL